MNMKSPQLIAAAALAALGLTACSDNGHGLAAANGVCKPFTTTSASTAAATPANALPAAPMGDPSASLDDCLHRWGYALAASSDPANMVADATLAACSSELTGWNQQSLSSGTAGGGEAPSLVNGQTTNPLAEHYSFAQGRALFYVVQARAGHCGAPPLANGAPTYK
ncbi:MAG: hypothetical protein E7812_13620 [Phenylobacterium sp.]|nr:MAG: hypothetical protein E7812_13620 [Phenylobacterium sp.]